MTIDNTPDMDGVTHINVYSKGKTQLGKLLSNFAHTPFTFKEKRFESVEAYWYYEGRNDTWDDPYLRTLYGFRAKEYGKTLSKGTVPDKDKLKEVYKAKIQENSHILELLLLNKLPLDHYYVYGTKIVRPKEFLWTALLWEELKKDYE